MFLGWLMFFAMGVAVVLLLNGLLFGGIALYRRLRKRPKSGVVASAAAGGAIVLALVAGADGPSPALLREAEGQAEHLRASGLEVRTVVVDQEEARRLQALTAEAVESELPPGELLVMLQEPDGDGSSARPAGTGLIDALEDPPVTAAAGGPTPEALRDGDGTSSQPAPIRVARLIDLPLGQ